MSPFVQARYPSRNSPPSTPSSGRKQTISGLMPGRAARVPAMWALRRSMKASVPAPGSLTKYCRSSSANRTRQLLFCRPPKTGVAVNGRPAPPGTARTACATASEPSPAAGSGAGAAVSVIGAAWSMVVMAVSSQVAQAVVEVRVGQCPPGPQELPVGELGVLEGPGVHAVDIGAEQPPAHGVGGAVDAGPVEEGRVPVAPCGLEERA